MDEKICCECGAHLTEESEYVFEDKVMCADCFHSLTTVCENCGDRIWNDDAEGDDHITLCYRCYENHYTTCDRCGRIIHQDYANYDDDDDMPYCDTCFEKLNKKFIHSYNHKPSPIFHGEGNLFMGVELEIDGGGEIGEYAKEIMSLVNIEDDHLYCKHDGSLNEGFEIVSHPMTLDYHVNEMDWQSVLERAVELGYSSHNTSTCGLHIHCSRKAFGEEYADQEPVIGRIVYFVEKHWNELVKFSRRKPSNLNRWAARYATISGTAKETYEKAKSKYTDRYVAVNLQNYATIEFRMFRGTLRYQTFIATLQLVHEICELAIALTDVEMEMLSWSDFVGGIDRESKSELIAYLKSKRLYVNEIEAEREDI